MKQPFRDAINTRPRDAINTRPVCVRDEKCETMQENHYEICMDNTMLNKKACFDIPVVATIVLTVLFVESETECTFVLLWLNLK